MEKKIGIVKLLTNQKRFMKINDVWYYPIVICDELNVGDSVIGFWFKDVTKIQIIENETQLEFAKQSNTFKYYKVLVQPETFSCKFLHALENSKVKEDDKVEVDIIDSLYKGQNIKRTIIVKLHNEKPTVQEIPIDNLTVLEKELLTALKNMMQMLPKSIPPIYKQEYEHALKTIELAKQK